MVKLDRGSLTRTTSAQQVANLLSEHILAGSFRPGEPLRESALATRLGVARNTVREATRILELSRLVRHEAHRGAVVISPTPESIEELFTARKHLEALGATSRASKEGLANLQAAFEELRSAYDEQDPRRMVQTDLEFHGAIVALIGNSRLEQFYDDMAKELRFYIVLTVEDLETFRPHLFVPEHEAIMKAILAGDGEAATELIYSHLDGNLVRLRNILKRLPFSDLEQGQEG